MDYKEKCTAIKRGWFGIYRGKEYKLVRNAKKRDCILTTDKNLIDDTFEDTYNSGVYTKAIDYAELEYAYEIRVHAIVDGKEVGVDREKGDKYRIWTYTDDGDIIEKYDLDM